MEMGPRARQTPGAGSRARDREARRGAKREQVSNEQRTALALAMIDAVAERGYTKTTVAHVISHAGVSRKTFYRHFANKEECFLATYDQISARAIRRMEQAYREAVGWP